MDSQFLPFARLISIYPEKEDIKFFCETDENSIANEWKIYRNPDGEICIKNLSASYLQVDEALLELNQEKRLFGGERLRFGQDNTYIFCVINSYSHLKRERDGIKEPDGFKKLVKVENDLQKELTCSICTNFLYKCMILTPCLHTFCSFCLFDFLKLSSQCPLCRADAVSVAKNSVLSNVVQIVADHFPPPLQNHKSHDKKELEQINLIGTIVRNEEGVYIGSYINGQRDGHGKFIGKSGTISAIYEGDWKNNKKQGKGVMIYLNGDKYNGNWMNDIIHGTGRYTWSCGQEYEGSYQNGSRTGYGVMKYPSGRIYKGDWKNGMKEGKGTMTYSCGDQYDGSWMNDHVHGTGKFVWSNGQEYEGEFQNDCFFGYGTMKYGDGRIYQGEWKDGEEEGRGVLILPNGDKYEGEWLEGILQSEVKIEYSSGEKYEGEIEVEELKKEGNGVLILENGDKYEGIWVDDVLQPQVTIEYINGDRYEGEINVENRTKEGYGILTFSNGDRYEGFWANDKQHGNGREISRNGKRVYEGVWKEGRICREGIMIDTDGKKYKAEWKALEEGENCNQESLKEEKVKPQL